MNRRQFNLLVAAGLVSVPRSLRAASEIIELPPAPPEEVVLEHWRLARSAELTWFEKSRLIRGEWLLVAQTVPVCRATGCSITEDAFDRSDCVALHEVPEPLRAANEEGAEPGAMTDFCIATEGAKAGPAPRGVRKSRDGRPPSRWARDLDTPQLRYWLASFEPPEAGVSGMTFLDHLVDGHSFERSRIEGLTLAEQQKLHGAAHGGF